MKVEFFINETGKKIKEIWMDDSALPGKDETVVLHYDNENQKFIVKTREFYYSNDTMEKVQLGLMEI